MRICAVIAVMAAACGAQVDVGRRSGGGDDEQPDAAMQTGDDATVVTPVDAPPPDATSVLTLCATKGYTGAPGLTSVYRRGASADWVSAEASCAADVPGATHLIVLSSQAEIDFALHGLDWVGLSDRATEGTFVNVTNEPNDQRPFSNGQPDNGSGSEDCAQLKSDGLDDDQCDNAHAFTCECDGLAPAP